jgi:DHA1 family bicyclomycin/chloramphenicol resistance-like MFS transporter
VTSATVPAFSAPYRPSARFVGLMGAMTALGAISIDMYLPSLPTVAADLGTTTGAAQFTISGVLIGAAIGQLLVGPLSDRFGRRAPALAGIALHVVASLLCMVVPNIAALIALRMLQGVGNAATSVTASAIIRDRLTGGPAARVLSRLILVIGIAPLLAPTLGGMVAGMAGWRAVFGLLAIVGVVLFVVVWRFLPESLPADARTSRGVSDALRGYRSLLADRHFMALAVLPGLALATVLCYVAAAPFVLQLGYGLSEGQFALIFAINGLGGIIASQVNAALLTRFSPIQVLRVMLPVTVLVGLVVLAVAVTGVGGLLGLLVPLWVLLSIHIFVPPNAKALAMTLRGERAGTAAALRRAAGRRRGSREHVRGRRRRRCRCHGGRDRRGAGGSPPRRAARHAGLSARAGRRLGGGRCDGERGARAIFPPGSRSRRRPGHDGASRSRLRGPQALAGPRRRPLTGVDEARSVGGAQGGARCAVG